MPGKLVRKPLGLQEYNGKWSNDTDIDAIYKGLLARGVDEPTARVLADEKRKKPIRREIREAGSALRLITTIRYHYYKERFAQPADHDIFTEFDTSKKGLRNPFSAIGRALGISWWYIATQTGDVLENLGLPKIPSLATASVVAAIPLLFLGGSAADVTFKGTGVFDPFSYDRARVVESRVIERGAKGEKVYEWQVVSRDEEGDISTDRRLVRDKKIVAKLEDIRYGDELEMPSGGLRNWAYEFFEPRARSDARYTGSVLVNPATYEGIVDTATISPEYSRGRGKLKFTAKADGKDDNSRELTYVGDESTVAAAAEILKGVEVPVRFNTNGHAGTLVATLGDNYAR